jgi:hypothetical protein
MRVSKYRNTRTEVDGVSFMSKREAKYYSDFKLMERAGEIRQLELQPKYPIVVNGVKVCTVILDFQFREKDGRLRVIDVKGMDNPLSKLKRKLVEAHYPHVTVEVVK